MEGLRQEPPRDCWRQQPELDFPGYCRDLEWVYPSDSDRNRLLVALHLCPESERPSDFDRLPAEPEVVASLVPEEQPPESDPILSARPEHLIPVNLNQV